MVRIQAGDVGAFEQLVERFENMVFGLARSIVGSREDAEEAAQDAFLKLFRARDRFDPDRPIEPWLLRITGNTCRDMLRRRRTGSLPSVDYADADLAALVADTHQSEAAERQVTNEVVQRELAALSEQARTPLVLKYLNGLTNQQVAEFLGISLSNVKVRVARAKGRASEPARKGVRRMSASNEGGRGPEDPRRGGQGRGGQGRGPRGPQGPNSGSSRDLSRFDPGPHGFQPSDPEDLRRFPARSDACRAVRQLLRDYADGDLSAASQRAVEEHIHACRDCSLALSRAEHEVYMLRRALPARSASLRPGSGFAGRVAARAMGELASELAQATASAEESRGAGDARPGTGRFAKRRWVMATAAALVVTLGASAWFGLRDLWSQPESAGDVLVEARLDPVVVRARDGYWPGRRRVRRGDSFDAGSALRVGSLGDVSLDLRSVSPEAGAPRPTAVASAGQLDVGADSVMVRDPEGRWALESGLVAAELEGELELDLVGGGSVTFSAGRFLVASTPVVRHDQALDPLGARRIRVEVSEGEASVTTADEQFVLGAGTAGVFMTGERLRTESLLGDAALAAAFEPAPDDAADEVWVSRVVDESTGLPLAGATVTLWTDSGPQDRRTDSEGRFRMAGLERWIDGADDPIVVAVRPAMQAGRGPLEPRPGLRLPAPCSLRSADARAGVGVSGPRLLAETIVVPPSRVVSGRVRALDHRPLDRAAVWPAVHDELLGTVEFLNEFVAFTDESGAFGLRGLPARTGPMQSLVALVVRDGFQPRLIELDADIRKGRNGPLLEVALEAAAAAELAAVGGDPTAQGPLRWQVATTVPQLGGVAALLRVVAADQGAIAVPALAAAGGGERWARPLLRNGSWGGWHTIEIGRNGLQVAAEAALQRDLPKLLRRQRGAVGSLKFSESALATAMGVDLVGGTSAGAVTFEWVAGLRYQHVLPRATGADAHWVSAVDMSSRHVRAIDVFVEGRDQRARFAGSFDSFSNCAVNLEPGMRVFGVDRTGAVGQIVLAPDSFVQRGVRVPMASLSRLELGDRLRNLQDRVRVQLRGSVPGVRGPMHLLRSAEVGGRWLTSWLPPGHWVATLPDGTSVEFMLDPGHTVTLQ